MEVEPVEVKETKGEAIAKKLEDIRALEETNPQQAVKLYKDVIGLGHGGKYVRIGSKKTNVSALNSDDPEGEIVSQKTQAIYALGELYAQKGWDFRSEISGHASQGPAKLDRGHQAILHHYSQGQDGQNL
eukprot:1365479-Amorphochlora_amoeboformis.AAC.1